MLFSLPLPGRTIVAAKLATMYTLDSVLNIIMLVPCGIFYGIFARPHVTFYLYYFILIFFASLIPILIASILSALMSMIASRFRHAQFVSIVLYIIFLFAVMSFSFTFRIRAASAASTEASAPGDSFIFSIFSKAIAPSRSFYQ